MTAGTFLVALTLVVLVLLLWHLRWVLLVLFGAVVVAVALDVLIVKVHKQTRLKRPQAHAAVLGVLLLAGGLLGQLLVPELISQFQQLGRDLPQLFSKMSDLLSSEPRLAQLNEAVGEGLNLKGLQPLLGFAGGAANSLIQLFLMALLAILLALDPSAHRHMVVAVTPRPARAQMEQLLDESRQALGGWLSGMTLSATAVFLLTWGGLLLLKAPLALLVPWSAACSPCAHHRADGGNTATHGISPAAIAAIDGVGAGVPTGAAEPGSLPAHTVVAAKL